VLVAGDDQLDQWYAAHPTELTRRAPERAVVNPQNPFVLRAQIACAAHELPLTPGDEPLRTQIASLDTAGLRRDGDREVLR
jgi:DEAD/DEAH box helicase domain-containing protein